MLQTSCMGKTSTLKLSRPVWISEKKSLSEMVKVTVVNIESPETDFF